MYDSKTQFVKYRIVSISQSCFRPIVKGKTKASFKFGAKLDLSLGSEGYGYIEKILLEAYNRESV